MVDTVSAEKRSWIQFKGWNLRKHPSGIVGNPDFGNKTRKIAVFIDGCFWHGCRKHFRVPKTNSNFWGEKISANRRRDRKVDKILLDDWWMVVRIWEHELVPGREKGSEKSNGA